MLIPVLLLVAALPGGGDEFGGGSSITPGPVAWTTHERGEALIPDPARRNTAVNGQAADSLRLDLELPAQARAGAELSITLRVRNVTNRPLDLTLRGRTIAFDIVVTRADGSTAWRRLQDEIIPAIIQLRTLAPGEAFALRTEWSQRTNTGELVGPGTYMVQGFLLTDSPQPLKSPAVALRILGG